MKNVLICVIALAPFLMGQTTAAKILPAPSPGSEGMSKELGEAILSELRQIRTLLERQQSAPKTPPAAERVKISGVGFSTGNANAPLTLVEFADYQCPFCRQFHSTVYEKLKEKYIDTGKLRFVSRDLPLDFHSNAFAAAHASRCAGEQNRFWQMRETLLSHADKLEPEAITGYARAIGLDMDRFNSCVASNKYAASIRADVAEASAAGIQGTPSFVLGKTSEAELTGVKLTGAQPLAVFEQTLNEMLPK